MDIMVQKTQIWLNATYGHDSRFKTVTESGNTGWQTIYALTRALQIELGIAATADSFGPSTRAKFNACYPNGITQQTNGDTSESNVYAIVQGALWCKGYSTGASGITKHFYSGTGSAIKSLKKDAGINSSSSTVTLDIMVALLSMNQYVNLWRQGGKEEIRKIQQNMNNNYSAYIGLAPCDGLYSREMNQAFIIVLQAIEGLSPQEATGNFGVTTKNKCPILPNGNNVNAGNKNNAIKLLKSILCCNGFFSGTINEDWNSELVDALKNFQIKYALKISGIADIDTWMSLLISKGNTDRTALACDCATILDSKKATALYNAGYRSVGRYLTGTVGGTKSKAMTQIEAQAIFKAGLRIFAIYQDNRPSVSYFTKSQGEADAMAAITAAKTIGIPYNEFIYFAVDYDMMDYQITSNVIPYFEGIRKIMRDNKDPYKVGVYGSRNVCTRLAEKALSRSSFVADMSTKFSGNMGFPIPFNWAFDQFHEYMFQAGGEAFGLDKDAYSGRYSGFNTLVNHVDDIVPITTDDDIYIDRTLHLLSILNIFPGVDVQFPIQGQIKKGKITLSYRAEKTSFYNPNTSLKNASITIAEGQAPEIAINDSVNLYKNLDASIKTGFDLDGNLNFVTQFEQEIQNGKINYGIGTTSSGDLILDYYIEELLWKNDMAEHKLYFHISITVEKPDPNSSDYNAYQSALSDLPNLSANGLIANNRVLLNGISISLEEQTVLATSIIMLLGLALMIVIA